MYAASRPAAPCGALVCQANLVGHWLDASLTEGERKRRLRALRAIGTLHLELEGTYWAYPGPETVRLIREWPR